MTVRIGFELAFPRKLYTYAGRCEKCSEPREMRTFEARKYFTLQFIPMFPTSGKRRALDFCPSCESWKDIPLADWEAAKKKAGTETLDALQANPNDEQAAIAAIAVAREFFDRELIEALDAEVGPRFASSAPVQRVLGVVLSFLSFPDQAEKAFQASLALQDDPATREAYALHLMRQHRPAEASQQLAGPAERLKADKEARESPEGLGTQHKLFVLAETFQSVGDHEGALRTFDLLDQIDPSWGQDKKVAKLRRQSEKKRGSSKKFKKPHLLHGREKVFRLQDAVAYFLAAMIGLLIVLGAFAGATNP